MLRFEWHAQDEPRSLAVNLNLFNTEVDLPEVCSSLFKHSPLPSAQYEVLEGTFRTLILGSLTRTLSEISPSVCASDKDHRCLL